MDLSQKKREMEDEQKGTPIGAITTIATATTTVAVQYFVDNFGGKLFEIVENWYKFVLKMSKLDVFF